MKVLKIAPEYVGFMGLWIVGIFCGRSDKCKWKQNSRGGNSTLPQLYDDSELLEEYHRICNRPCVDQFYEWFAFAVTVVGHRRIPAKDTEIIYET